MKCQNFKDAFISQLKDVYSAERQLIDALTLLAKETHSNELKEAYKQHLKETRNQIVRLDTIFHDLGLQPEEEYCEAMAGIIAEGKKVIKENPRSLLRDSLMISASQRVENYEMAAYNTLITLAEHLNMDQAAKLLRETYEEEENTDSVLETIAEETIFSSLNEDSEEGEEEYAMVSSRRRSR